MLRVTPCWARVAVARAASCRSRVAVALAALAVVLLAPGCGAQRDDSGAPATATADDPVRVVATTPIVADWVRRVGGKRIDLVTLVDADVDPHDFEPGPREADAAAEARLLVASGAGFDDWAEEIAAGAGDGLEVTEIAPADGLRTGTSGDDGDTLDPHYWHDPRLARRAVDAIAAALAAADPGGAAAYEANARAYGSEIAVLDRELERRFADVPADRRKIVTSHAAFGYLADRYGLEIIGTVIPSTSTAAEPSAKDTAALIDAIRANRVTAIFSEATVDPKLARQVAAETGASVHPDLLADTLAPAGRPGSDYLGMMRHNAETILRGLAG